jgi:protein phosphatase PTC6
VSVSRGTRPYNEDTYQAGVIELPAFAKRSPVSLTTRAPASSPLQAYRENQRRQREEEEGKKPVDNAEATSAEGASGDPQVFYFAVFDGHGGAECSEFLRESLHDYIEDAAEKLQLTSSLRGKPRKDEPRSAKESAATDDGTKDTQPTPSEKGTMDRILELETNLIKGWRELVGGYFRRFKPAIFSESENETVSISTVLTYAFLRADFDFVSAQARKPSAEDDAVLSDGPLNASDVLHSPYTKIEGSQRFKGGSTSSVALISTPSPTPFWHPASPSTLIIAHVGDTRILLCRTSDGKAVPLTTNHHPGNPGEGQRLRRYAGSFVTDSFGEERMSGLANTRAFGDMGSKRIGVSAEPEIRRVELAPAQYSFLVLISDGISGTLSDQEIVDVVKEAKTPDQGAKDVVSFGTEVSSEGDNATCIVVRMGGWERRSEGGLGSMGTKETRDFRRQEATDPRSRRT